MDDDKKDGLDPLRKTVDALMASASIQKIAVTSKRLATQAHQNPQFQVLMQRTNELVQKLQEGMADDFLEEPEVRELRKTVREHHLILLEGDDSGEALRESLITDLRKIKRASLKDAGRLVDTWIFNERRTALRGGHVVALPDLKEHRLTDDQSRTFYRWVIWNRDGEEVWGTRIYSTREMAHRYAEEKIREQKLLGDRESFPPTPN